MEALIFPIIAIIIFIFLSDTVTFAIIYENEFTIDIDFTIFGIRFYQSERENKNKIRKKASLNKNYKALKIIRNIISYSNVSVIQVESNYQEIFTFH